MRIYHLTRDKRQSALTLDPPDSHRPGRLEGSFHSPFVRTIREAAWPEIDLDDNLADVVILGLWDRLPKE